MANDVKMWTVGDMNPETARPASGYERQARYQRRRAQRQARVTVWLDRADVAFLDAIPLNRSELLRGLVGMARRGQVPLPGAAPRPGLFAAVKAIWRRRSLPGPAATPDFLALGEREAPIMGKTTPNSPNALQRAPRGAGSLLDYSGYLDDPEPPDLLSPDLAPRDDDLAELDGR